MAIKVVFGGMHSFVGMRCPRCHRQSTFTFKQIKTEKVTLGTVVNLVFECSNSHHSYSGRTVFCMKKLTFSTCIPTEIR